MKVNAHCFAHNINVSPLPIKFNYNDVEVTIHYNNHDNKDGLMLKISRDAKPEDFEVSIAGQDEQGQFIERQLRPFTELLMEIAVLLEGLMSIYYYASPPKFNPHEIMVNLVSETPEEESLISSGKISGGFGVVMRSGETNTFEWADEIIQNIIRAKNHLPAFSFLAQAIRSQYRHDQEVSFFLYFRIIDGYFVDGLSQVEKYLLEKKADLLKILPYESRLIQAISSGLKLLNMPSKSDVDYDGLIKDLVMMRHKLTHFSETHSDRHFQLALNFELDQINSYLRSACMMLLRDKIS